MGWENLSARHHKGLLHRAVRKLYKLDQELNLAGEGCTGALEAHTGRGPNSWATPAGITFGMNHQANPSGKPLRLRSGARDVPPLRRACALVPRHRTGWGSDVRVGGAQVPGSAAGCCRCVESAVAPSRPESREASSVAGPQPWERPLPWVGQRGPCRVRGGPGARVGPARLTGLE